MLWFILITVAAVCLAGLFFFSFLPAVLGLAVSVSTVLFALLDQLIGIVCLLVLWLIFN